MLRPLLLLLLLAPSAAAFQWSLSERGPDGADLVVEATLLRTDASVVRAHGSLYERTRSTLLVHRVVYRDAEAPPPGATLELYAAHHGMPWIAHGLDAFRRGLWVLSRSEVEGVYTANRSWPCRPLDVARPSAPRTELVGGWFDPVTGEAELAVRYENFGPDPVELDELSFDAEARPRGLESGVTLQGDGERSGLDLPRSLDPAPDRLTLAPWTFVRRSVRFTLPVAMRSARSVTLRTRDTRLPRVRDPLSGTERVVIDLPLGVEAARPIPARQVWRESCHLHPRRPATEGETDELSPPWLHPSSPQWTVFTWPPVWAVALALVGGAAAARARRVSPRGRRVATWTVVGAAALLPWALLGPGPLVLRGPLPVAALLLAGALFALLARPLRARSVSYRAFGRALLAPPVLLLAAHVALRGRT